MAHSQHIEFAQFVVDLGKKEIWGHDQQLSLRPKLFALLRCLVEHGGRLVTRDELTQAVYRCYRCFSSYRPTTRRY